MYNIIPLFLILFSLLVIIVIITRKFPVLANLDLNTIQSEKEAQFKEQIIGNRLKRNVIRYNSKLVNTFKPIVSSLTNWLKVLYKKLLVFKENYNREEAPENRIDGVEKMVDNARELLKEEKVEEAEKQFIEAISVDSQNLKAFKGLGKLYVDKKQFAEAKQTFEHVLRLLERDELKVGFSPASKNKDNKERKTDNHYLSSIYYELAKACQGNEEHKLALQNIIKATEIEPGNPRYLDMKLEISIMNKDKGTAFDALKKLEEVNPDNNKLEEFKEKVREL